MILNTQHIEVCTITEALVLTRGNKTELSRMLKRNRGTIRKYLEEEPGMLVQLHRDEKTYITGISLINSTRESGCSTE